MSHCVSVDLTIDDLPALRAACAELGLTWHEGQTTYKWYGSSVGDYPLPAGFTADMLGKCQHAISVPGAEYQIGVVKNPIGAGYKLLFDFWGSREGQPIIKRLGGEDLPKLKQFYGVNRAQTVARRQGLQTQRVLSANGSVKLVITGRTL